MQRKTINVLFLLVFFLAGCANKPPMPDLKTVEQNSLGFLVTGKTTREDVLLELGPAYRAYENERILTYALWYEANKGLVPIPHRMYLADKLYLVLVFDERGILKRRKLKSGGK